MKLEGKFKNDFFEWLINKNLLIWTFGSTPKEKKEFGYSIYLQGIFEHLPQSAQYGLIQEYALSEKILIEVKPSDGWDDWGYEIIMEDCMSPFFTVASHLGSESCAKAQIKAVEQIQKIING